MTHKINHAETKQKISTNDEELTCHEQQEEKLQMLAAIVQSSDDAIIGKTLDGVIKSWNPAAEKIYGYAASEVLGENISMFLPPNQANELNHILNKILRGESVAHFKTKRLRKDGRLIDIALTVSPIKNSRGEIIGASSIVKDITEQERANEELKKWLHVFENAEWGVVVVSADTEIMEMINPAFAKMHGYTVEELSGQTIVNIFAPNNHTGSFKHMHIAREKGHHTFESKHVRKDGSIFPVLVDVTAVRDAKGQLSRLVINVQDITERKEAEAALLKSEENLREAQKITKTGSWDWNILTNELLWSDEIYKIFGLKPGEFDASYNDFLNVVHPEDRELVTSAVGESLNRLKPYDVEHRIVRPDGAERIVHEQGTIFSDEEGKPIRMVGTVHDVTEQIMNRRERQKLAMAVEQASDWILITDKEGRIEYTNNAVEEITGYTKEELLGQTPRVFKSGKHDKVFYKELWDTILAGRTYRNILTNRHKDGSFFEIYHGISPLKDTHGNITHFVATSKDITQQKALEEKLNYLAYYDVLTGLPNRILFMDRLSQVISRTERRERKVAVVCLDIDRFRVINDSYGYEIGDTALKEIGKRFSQAVHEGDTVARFGADEYGIILSNMTHSEDVVRLVDNLMRKARKPIRVNGLELILTLSVGISLFPDDDQEITALVRNADIAMSKAKGTGMNNYQFFQSDMNIRAAEFVLLDRHLRQALKNNEFVLHYQPYFHAQTGAIAGMEVLLRWDSEDLGLVMPARFIPILEDTGMIIEVGQWIFRAICAQIKSWQRQGLSVVPVAFNLSAAQFRQKNLVDMISETIKTSAVDPRYLTLEITESTFMQDLIYTGLILEKLKSLGLRLAIDDFGTGYSSLSYLKRFSLDILKIDISFIRDIATSPDDKVIVSAITSLAHSLNLKTIAEGVETEAQLNILRSVGCDLIQGFYFSRPLPAADAGNILPKKTT